MHAESLTPPRAAAEAVVLLRRPGIPHPSKAVAGVGLSKMEAVIVVWRLHLLHCLRRERAVLTHGCSTNELTG